MDLPPTDRPQNPFIAGIRGLRRLLVPTRPDRDGLTGALNRKRFFIDLQSTLQTRKPFALVLADALLERFGGDSIADLKSRVTATGSRIRGRVSRRPAAARA